MPPCPSDETLGALVHRALGEDEAAVVRSHLDDCDACREIVIAAVRGQVGAGPQAEDLTRHLDTFARGTSSKGGRDTSPAVGDRLGRYELRGILGTGGMGRVYDAYDGELDRYLALKVMRPELSRGGGVVAERLVRESRIMAKVVHPSVITVYDVGRVGDAVFIAMERIRGSTLGAYIAKTKPSWREILELFERAGEGLAAAHDAGIVHRDFKPDNVLVETDGAGAADRASGRVTRVVVTDFGVAHTHVEADTDHPSLHPSASGSGTEPVASESRDGVAASNLAAAAGTPAKLTTTGAAIGTPAYMAPEQLDGERVDRRADVFAFAASAWEALCGERPFPGRTIAEIRAATMQPPRPPRGANVPARVVRALERGLAETPEARWQDMPSLLRALRGRRTARWLGASAVAAALVGVGIVATRALAETPVDPCQLASDSFERVIAEPRLSTMRATLGPKVMTTVDQAISYWRDAHAATCTGDEAQRPVVTACLDARRQELSGFLDDVELDGNGHAQKLVALLEDPRMCKNPAPGNLASKVPVDPVMRRKVTAVRYIAFDAESARDRADFPTAIAGAEQAVAKAKDLWPPVYAETLYLLGSTYSLGGDNKKAMALLRDAAAVAERAHHDYIAASAWVQLVLDSVNDEGSPAHALEYVTYAEAAAERIGRPPETMTLLDYAKGMALVANDRPKEGEAVLHEALKLAEGWYPAYLSTVIQGLGYLYQAQARYPEAIEAYRKAIARLPVDHNEGSPLESTFRSQLAANLSQAGFDDEAIVEARKAVAINDRVLTEDNLDRATAHGALAQVLGSADQLDEGLAEAHYTTTAIAKVAGDRNERYGEALELEAYIENELGRHAEAVKKLERACDIIAFATGDDSGPDAECWTSLAPAAVAAGEVNKAFALADKSIPVLEKLYGADHPHLGMAYAERGEYVGLLGDHDKAIDDLSRAVDILGKASSDPGHLFDAIYHLGTEVWHRDRARGRALALVAHAFFSTPLCASRPRTSKGSWHRKMLESRSWLSTHR